MTHRETSRWAVLLTSGLLMACSTSIQGRRAPRHYAQSLDSVSSACRQNPENCAAAMGEGVAVPAPASAQAAARLAVVAAGVRYAIEAEVQVRIDAALAECADMARSEVLLQHLEGRSPTYEECTEVLFTRPGGEEVTRAMWFGEQMHQSALRCTEQKLNEFLRGRFSVEPRYRLNSKTGQVEWLSPEEVQTLLRQGQSRDLRGTIVPDVVIHLGHPTQVQLIYDFKFPCVNTDQRMPWRVYPRGNPHAGLSQEKVYAQFLGARARRVQPRIGVEP